MRLIVPALASLALLMPAAAPAQPQNGAGQRPATPVFATTAQPSTIADKIEALGTLRANETVTLTATVSDIVTAVRFEDGQRVAAGDVLLEMASAEETAQLREAQAAVSEAERQMKRLQPLVRQGAASKSALDAQERLHASALAQLEVTKARLDDRLITAPFDGVVGLRNISLGTLLQPGTAITTLNDDSVMKLDFAVPALFLPALKPGMTIEARTRVYPERVFEGTVHSIDTQIEPVSRSITVRALLPNDEKILRPGLLMTVTLSKGEREALVVPELSLLVEGADQYVYVIEGETARRRKVTTGLREPGSVEITGGLKAGEQIVGDGVMKISEGARISVRATRDNNETLRELLQQEPPAPAAGNAE